jgi:hypothetical protein
VIALLAAPAVVSAWDVEVDSDTAFQAYEVRSPGTSAFMARRRLVQTLGVAFARRWDPADDRSPRLLGSVRLRLDEDFGDTCLVARDLCVRATNVDDGGAYQPLAEETRVDAPLAWIEVAELPLGAMVRAGRQLHADAIGFVRFDGGRARMEPWTWLAAEVLGGRVVRRTSIAGTAAFEPEGSLRLEIDPEEIDPARLPYLEEPAEAWIAGGAIEIGPRRWVRGRVAFREMQDADGVIARRGSVGLITLPTGGPRAGADAVVDLIDLTVVDALAWAELDVGPVTLRAGAERHVPRFDLGTIWGYFDLVPVDEARVGANVELGERVQVGADLRGRRAVIDEVEETDLIVDARARARVGALRLGASGFLGGGDLGPAAGLGIDASRRVHRLVELELRASVWHVDDPLREPIHGTSVAEALGARWTITDQTTVHAEIEHATSRVVGHRFRLLLQLSIEAWR